VQQELVAALRRAKNHDDVSDDVKQFMALQRQKQLNMVGPRASALETKKVETEEYEDVLKEKSSLLFNLNTIEAVMLATTVLINLAGIMLSSGQFQNLESHEKYQVDLISYTVLFAISGCMLLLSVALAREVWLARNIERNMTRARWRVAIKRQIKINRKKRARVKRFQDAVYQAMERVGMKNQSVIGLKSDFEDKDDDNDGFEERASFGNFLKFFSGSKTKSSRSAVLPEDPVDFKRQHEVELNAQQEILSADKVEQDERFEKKLEKRKKRKKKNAISDSNTKDMADTGSIVPGGPPVNDLDGSVQLSDM